MSWIEDIKNRQNDNGQLSRQWLEAAEQDAPYSVLPALMYLKSNGIKDNEDVLARLAIAFPDRQALALMLGEDADALTGFYPAEHAEQESLDTITTIDRFLDNYGKTSPGEIEAITRAIFNPQPDYADVLAAQEQEQGGSRAATDDAQDELIDKFIAQQMELSEQAAQVPINTPVNEEKKAEIAQDIIEDPTENDDSMLSESLAQMYIARNKYSQALEIIKGLSLKYPEKSIYFADQIRFLTKLVLNETLNNEK